MKYDIKSIKLADKGELRIEFAEKQMDVLREIRERFRKEKPLKGLKIGACLHVTSETANLMRTLKVGGAKVFLCASNPLSTQNDVAAALVKFSSVSVYAIKGENRKKYYQHLNAVLDVKPNITLDDGADLVSTLHAERPKQLNQIRASMEETTTGVIRLRSMEKDKVLKIPVIAVNDAKTKHFFDNRYGTGQSTIDGVIRATNILLAGKNVVIAGYGWCGRGAAMRAEGLGAHVIVTEIDPLKAIEAVMDGYRVMPMEEVAKIGDIFITLTGDINVVRPEHFAVMKNEAVVCNSGHFDVEIDIKGLKAMSSKVRKTRDFIEEFTLKNKKKINLLAGGRLINLAAAEGHPASVMDMSFANQALCSEWVAKNYKKLKKQVYSVPEEIDELVAAMKLKTMGVKIDKLTEEQKKYLASWTMGT